MPRRADPEQVLALAEHIENYEQLHCAGVMAVAPLGSEPDMVFEKLWNISQILRESFPQATQISAGMSGGFRSGYPLGVDMRSSGV